MYKIFYASILLLLCGCNLFNSQKLASSNTYTNRYATPGSDQIIFFKHNQIKLSVAQEFFLKKHGAYVKHNNCLIELVTHQSNEEASGISLKRANFIKNFLQVLQIDPAQIQIKDMADKVPLLMHESQSFNDLDARIEIRYINAN